MAWLWWHSSQWYETEHDQEGQCSGLQNVTIIQSESSNSVTGWISYIYFQYIFFLSCICAEVATVWILLDLEYANIELFMHIHAYSHEWTESLGVMPINIISGLAIRLRPLFEQNIYPDVCRLLYMHSEHFCFLWYQFAHITTYIHVYKHRLHTKLSLVYLELGSSANGRDSDLICSHMCSLFTGICFCEYRCIQKSLCGSWTSPLLPQMWKNPSPR